MSVSLLQMYRRHIKAVRKYPSANRKRLERDIKLEWRDNQHLTDPKRIEDAIIYGENGLKELTKYEPVLSEKYKYIMSVSLLQMYRRHIKAVRKYPSANRKRLERDIKLEWRDNQHLTDPKRIEDAIIYGENGLKELTKYEPVLSGKNPNISINFNETGTKAKKGEGES
eukprot:TRINITY_DN12284_c0_g1_i1.p1 TRINITY_DN12284_c0_g1~~TRINITY_DN12284_c0_g1_i1.p1  ORF type:complete len:182 (-),score=36.58 TRINITY_DN12284_c0_g1_i1:104-610(-)